MSGVRGFQTIICKSCGKEAIRKIGRSLYCIPCSAEKAAFRAGPTNPRRAAVKAANKEAIRLRGLQRSAFTKLSEITPTRDYLWQVRFAVPFTYAASKNHIYALGGHHVVKREETRRIEAEIEAETRDALATLQHHSVVQNKLWVGLFVEKPNHRGDAVNVVDIACDAIKKAAGIDDRWFCIDFVDWAINKNNPRIIIQLSQESEENVQICSACGMARPFSFFGKHSASRHGIHRTCIECKSPRRSQGRAAA